MQSLHSNSVHAGIQPTRCLRGCIPWRPRGRNGGSFYNSEGFFRNLRKLLSTAVGVRNPTMEFGNGDTSSFSLFSPHPGRDREGQDGHTPDSPLHWRINAEVLYLAMIQVKAIISP